MVQLRSYYSLCPLIDKNSFLGVSEDIDSGCGIVSLGKNVVTRYKFSDQKQLSSWTSKDHITAPVVYDTIREKYVGVFNQNVIKTWNANVQTLDKLKKKKFSKPILKIIRNKEGNCTVVFKDGDCAALSYAIDARKIIETIEVIKKDEVIIDAAICTLDENYFMCYICKSNNNYSIYTFDLNIDVNSPCIETLLRVEIEREEFIGGKIAGITISGNAEPPQVHILWSDGRLFTNILKESTFSLVGHVPWICAEVEVTLAWMGGKHIALYGTDSAQEGAILAVFNVLFGIGTCSHPLKLFCKGARLWCLHEYILLEATQNIAVVPFISSTHRNMLALLGSYKNRDDENVLMADWGKGKADWKCKETWNELASKGVSEREICAQYFPSLLEKNNINTIKASIKEFTDIPENIISMLMLHVINKLNVEHLAENIENIFTSNLDKQQLELTDLLNSLLNIHYVKENMISCIRRSFSLSDMLFLLKYITFLLTNEAKNKNYNVNFELNIILWSTILIDSHYQLLVLSNENATQKTLFDLTLTIDNLINAVECAETLVPVLKLLCTGKGVYNKMFVHDTPTYYIEEIKIQGF